MRNWKRAAIKTALGIDRGATRRKGLPCIHKPAIHWDRMKRRFISQRMLQNFRVFEYFSFPRFSRDISARRLDIWKQFRLRNVNVMERDSRRWNYRVQLEGAGIHLE